MDHTATRLETAKLTSSVNIPKLIINKESIKKILFRALMVAIILASIYLKWYILSIIISAVVLSFYALCRYCSTTFYCDIEYHMKDIIHDLEG